MLGVNEEGEKDIMSIWIGENESAKFCLNVLNEIKRRGVKDILIMCSDGLTGMKEMISTSFPKTVQQRCIVHMIRNSVRFIYYKDLKVFYKDLKNIYTSKNEKAGYNQLQKMRKKWKDKYPSALKNWEDNWDAVYLFFAYSEPVRKIMYTTNAIESLNRPYRKYTKTKFVFPSDQALMKCMYLATMNITKKWITHYHN
jgi:transposase-like protein